MAAFTEYLNFRLPPIDILAIILCLALSCVVCVLLYVLKNILRRLKYAGVPGPTFYNFDILGSLRFFPFTLKARNGYSMEAIALQITEGLAKLFPNDSFILAWLTFHPIALATKPEAIQVIMTDSSLIEKPFFYKFLEPIIGKGLVTSIGSKWKPRRRMLNPSYHVSVLMDFMPVFNEHGGKLVKKLQEGTEGEVVELLKPISLCVLDVVCETILGTKLESQETKNIDYFNSMKTVFSIFAEREIKVHHWPDFAFRYSENGKKFYKHLEVVYELTKSVLNRKKKEYLTLGPNPNKKSKPLMDVLLEFHMEKKNITEEEIIEEINTFLTASSESTSASIMFTLYLVGLDNTIQDTAHQELDDIFGDDRERPVEKGDLTKMNYIECIVKESLRLFPTVPVISRELPDERAICGYKLPKGTTLAVVPFVLHRNPEIFPDPERFDPSRFFPENCTNRSPYAYIPFSAGARNCIGQKFAMTEMKVILAHVLRNFTVESLDTRDKILPAAAFSLRTDTEVRFKLFARK